MGLHLVLDLENVKACETLDSLDQLKTLFDFVHQACNIHVINSTAHRFEPQGISLVYILAESYSGIHTYPEHAKCHIDLYHCGPEDQVQHTLDRALAIFHNVLGGDITQQLIIKRD